MSSNPYQSSKPTDESSGDLVANLGRFVTLCAAILICVATAVVVGEVLSVLVLFPPMNRWFHMTGEFDGLILIGMPMWVGGFSLICGIVLGLLYPRRGSLLLTLTVGTTMVGISCRNLLSAADSRSEWFSAVTFTREPLSIAGKAVLNCWTDPNKKQQSCIDEQEQALNGIVVQDLRHVWQHDQ